MPLPEEFMYKLRSANRIDEVISSYVSLERAGRLFKCRCPFHQPDRTPSFTVYPDTESFYCFGCQAGGDVITFVMKMENLSYIEAVKKLAERAGLPMPEEVAKGDDFTRRKQRLYEMNKKAARFFFDNLRGENGLAARQYLRKRGLTPATITKYGIGFANTSWTTLRDYMRAEGFSDAELESASLIARSSRSGGTYDFFMNRVMFPFIDLQGHIVGFGGRTLGDDKRKYLNSKETITYKKSNFLFSMNFAKMTAAKTKRLLLCEGNMDVVSLNQAGFENSVATCGTSLTEEHARMIAQYADEVVICYDADGAGRAASNKAITMLSQVGIKSKVIDMKGAKDPDEYILKYGKDRFAYLLDNSDGAVAYNLKRCEQGIDMDSDLGKVDYLKRVCEVLADIPNRLEREVYISKISDEQKISQTVISENIDDILKKRSYQSKRRQWQQTMAAVASQTDVKSGEPAINNKLTKAQEGLLSFIIAHPDKLTKVSQRLSGEHFPTKLYRKLYDLLCIRPDGAQGLTLSSLNEHFEIDEMGRLSRIFNLQKDIIIDERAAEDYINLLLHHSDELSGGETDLAQLARKKRNSLK